MKGKAARDDGSAADRAPISDGADITGYRVALTAAQLVLVESSLESERPGERLERKKKVRDLIIEDLTLLRPGRETPEEILRAFRATLEPEARTAFLVEVHFLDAFSPYTIRTRLSAQKAGLRRVAEFLGSDREEARRIRESAESAKRSHARKRWGRAGLIGIGAAVLVGLGGFLAAPLLGAAVGAGAGLTGAAATSYGLALLGGGSLAAGGAGVAGGIWLIGATSAAAGLAAGGGGAALYEMGAAQARGELIKLQVMFKVSVLGNQADLARAQEIISRLSDRGRELEEHITVERALNDRNSRRVAELEESFEAVEEAISWMQEERKQAEDPPVEEADE